MSYSGTVRFVKLSVAPPSPPVGYVIFYAKSDDVIYAKDSAGNETPLGATTAITSLTGDVSATGPGVATAVVVQVGGKTASQIAASVNDTQAATHLNTPNTIVKRDSSGNIHVGSFTAAGDLIVDTNVLYVNSSLNRVGINTSTPSTALEVSGTVTATNFSGPHTGLTNGVDASSHASRHLPSGADPLTTAAPITNLSPATTNTTGTANSFARSDHTHAIETGTTADVTTIQPNDSANAGTANRYARADHKHAISTAAPSTNLSPATSNAEGTSTSFARADHTHAIETGTTADITTIQPDDTANAGTLDKYARADHRHAINTAAPITQIPDQVNAEGTSTSFARADHVHNIPTDVPVQIGTANFIGSASSFARSDHVHCFSEDTELLTKNGFVKYTDIKPFETEALTLNLEKNILEYQPVQQVHQYSHFTELYSFKDKWDEILLTEEHRVLRYGNSKLDENENIIYELTAREAFELDDLKIPVSGYSEGVKYDKSDEFFKLLGFLLANPRFSLIKNILNKFFIKSISSFISEDRLSDKLMQIRGSQFKAFLSGLSFFEKRVINFNKNKILAEQIQHLCVLNGLMTKIITKNGRYVLIIKNKKFVNLKNKNKIAYSGNVWCVTVPNSTVVVRRNGFVFIAGNSHGNQTNPNLHALATTSAHGFMSSSDKTKLDNATPLNIASTLVERDSSGNFAANQITQNAAILKGTSFNLTLTANPSANYTLQFPNNDGAGGASLFTDGSGNLYWALPLSNVDGGNANTVFLTPLVIDGGTP